MKEMKLEIPADCEVDKIETQYGHIVVTFREKKRKLPKSWEEFCEMYPIPFAFATTKTDFDPLQGYLVPYHERNVDAMHRFTSDRATAEAVLALCQLIQLRDCYNQGLVPDYENKEQKFVILFSKNDIEVTQYTYVTCSPLYFKSEELRDEFLDNFSDLIEKLKPLYGITKGGEE